MNKKIHSFLALFLLFFSEALAQEDDIMMISGPEQVFPGSVASVQVTYEAALTRKIGIYFQMASSPWTIHGVASVIVTKGSGIVTVDVPVNNATPIKNNWYKYVAFITTDNGGWNDRFDSMYQPDVDCLAIPATDKLIAISGPSQVSPGDTIFVSVTYDATTNRDILASFKKNGAPEISYGSQRTSVQLGRGTVNIGIPINATSPIADDAYKFDVSLLPVEGGSTNILDNDVQIDVDCVSATQTYTLCPTEYPHALRNPLKGFRPSLSSTAASHEYGTITQSYIKWNEIENDESDTVQKIIDFCNNEWAGVEEQGIKVIPRVYLDWDSNIGNEYWPADMTAGDYSSTQFTQRLQRLIYRIGEVWDNDPRVAWVQMGIIGYWGEQHHPYPTEEIQTLMGDAFSNAFTNKKFLARCATHFTDYEIGIYWDSWAHIEQVYSPDNGLAIENLNNTTGRWKTCPIEGETAYNWGNYQIQPGNDPNDTLTNAVHRDFLLDTIRNLHCSGLGWISSYDQSNEEVCAGAEEVQKAFGYRFVIKQFTCPRRTEPGEMLNLNFSVLNTGSAPFYENWPLEFSLLDPATYTPAWKTTLKNVDIRQWLPGDNWDETSNVYIIQPETNIVNVNIQLPDISRLPVGEYIVALSILDPVGLQPNVKFAIANYLHGGRHPFCRIGIGVDTESGPILDPKIFADPMKEDRLPYMLQPSHPPTRAIITDLDIIGQTLRIQAQDSGSNTVRIIQRSEDLLEWEATGIFPGTGTVFEWTEPVDESVFFRVLTE